MAKIADRYYDVDPQAVIERGFDPKRGRQSESIFSLASETMGVRGYFEEGYSGDRLVGCYVNGLYERMDIPHPQVFKGFVTEGAFAVNTVDWLYTWLRLDGEYLDLATSRHSEFVRRLDLRTAVLTRSFVWQVGGKRLRVTFERFVHLTRGGVAAQRVTLEPLNFSGSIDAAAGLDFSVPYELAAGWSQLARDDAGPRGECFWQCPRKRREDGRLTILGRSVRVGQRLVAAADVRGIDADFASIEEDKLIGLSGRVELTEGQATTIDRVAALHWARDPETPDDEVWDAAGAALDDAAGKGYDALLAEHADAWARAWETLDLDIDADAELQQGVRFSLMQFYSTYQGRDPRLNIPAKGMTGEVYYGLAFWDTETYCLTQHLFHDPAAARALLEYRHIFLPQARERARELGCRGARYPFATIDGTECCGTWQHCDLEVHVDLAISYAIWHYVHVTGDKAFLREMGAEMLVEISRYMADRGEWSPNGDFGVYGVMGPDEFHMMVHNNCYTNSLTQRTLRYTLEVLEEMAREAPDALAGLAERVGLEDGERDEWRAKADAMRIPYDTDRRLYEQHDGYFDLPEVDVANLPPEQIPIYANWVYEKIFRYNMIKQPDVLLLAMFFSRDFDLETLKANYEYYEARCVHESSLSPSVHSVLAAELGRGEQAAEFFRYTARLDLDNYNRNVDQGLHVTAMSGVWLNVVFGFAGLRTDGPVLSFKPSIPDGWGGYRFRLRYRGSLMEVRVDADGSTSSFRVVDGGDVDAELYGEPMRVTRDGLTAPLRELPLE